MWVFIFCFIINKNGMKREEVVGMFILYNFYIGRVYNCVEFFIFFIWEVIVFDMLLFMYI